MRHRAVPCAGDNGRVGIVEWTRLEGGQVEAVVAMFVNRERPTSVRITPSRGDGGVDILDRGAGPDGTDVVYQVKRYTEALTAKQKDDIESSLERLTTDPRWQELSVREWRLVTPWDPTPEAETWLHGLDYPGVTKIWHGLTWVDQQAAKYDDVIDFYLHGGRTLVEKAHAEVMALLGAANMPGDLTVPEVQGRLQDALRALDHDPHYRYEHRFGEGPPPTPPRQGDRPGLVMHTQAVDPGRGSWSTVDIIARCAASAEERPITIKGQFRAEPDSEFARELKDFFTYGAPFTSPDGAFDGNLDAPGGLGGPIEEARVWVGPTEDHDLGENPDLHLEVLDPDGITLAEVDVRRTDRSRGAAGGVRIVFEEVNGLFVIEDRYNLPESRGSRAIRLSDWTGNPVRTTQAAINLLTQLRSPNRLRWSVRHTAPSLGVVDNNIGFDWGEDLTRAITAAARVIEALTAIQQHSSTVILMPSIETVTRDQFASWKRAAAVLSGEDVSATYPEGHCLVLVLETEVTVSEGEDLRVLLPLRVQVGEQSIEFGLHEVALSSPTVVERRNEADGVLHALTIPDRTVRWRRHAASDEVRPSEPESDEGD